MLQKTNAIVISSLRYADTSLIVKCYTEAYGIKSYLLKGILSKKKGNLRKALFLPLTQLEIVAYHNNKGSLNSIKEVKIANFYQSLQTDIVKQSLVIFLSEVLGAVLQEEEENEALYKYLEGALIWLDSNDKIANFHLLFLLDLTKFLGFYPENNSEKEYFDLQEGKFVNKPISNHFIKSPQITHFKNLLGTNFAALHKIKITALERRELLELLIQYISLHLQTFKTPKSLEVLQNL